MSQKNRVLMYMKSHGSITPKEAWTQCGCYRLADAIYKLRGMGCQIDTVEEEGKDQFGNKCKYARYVLKGVSR